MKSFRPYLVPIVALSMVAFGVLTFALELRGVL